MTHRTVTNRINLDLPSSVHPTETVREIQRAYFSVPKDRRHTAQFECEAGCCEEFGERYFISWERLETAIETAARVKEQHRLGRIQEARDKQEYERLHARFGGS